jgi:hypothetical protein
MALPKELDSDFFDKTPILGVGSASYDEDIHIKPRRIDDKWCQDRCEMFQRMTQGRGKPMIYGSQKKDKK